MKTSLVKSIVLALIVSLTMARSALAYIDPNTGGMLFQVLAAGFAVFSGIILIFSRQIRTALGKAKRKTSELSEEQHAEASNEDK